MEFANGGRCYTLALAHSRSTHLCMRRQCEIGRTRQNTALFWPFLHYFGDGVRSRKHLTFRTFVLAPCHWVGDVQFALLPCRAGNHWQKHGTGLPRENEVQVNVQRDRCSPNITPSSPLMSAASCCRAHAVAAIAAQWLQYDGGLTTIRQYRDSNTVKMVERWRSHDKERIIMMSWRQWNDSAWHWQHVGVGAYVRAHVHYLQPQAALVCTISGVCLHYVRCWAIRLP